MIAETAAIQADPVGLARQISATTVELDHLTEHLAGEPLRLAKKHCSTLHAIAIELASARAHEIYGSPEPDEVPAVTEDAGISYFRVEQQE